jgi:tRNA A-37 threonylcarbamoyl transferase component Bud32/dienelactone hydrolase
LIGKTFAHYKISGLLGKGGMGEVYRAYDTRLDRTVALKFLSHSELTSDRDKTRFVREAKTASALDHPNVVTIFDIQETADGQTFIVMAHYEGETLEERLSGGPLPIDTAVDFAKQIAEGLSAAHASSILHRDIKPSNILVTEAGLLKIVDFGLAKDLGATALTMVNQTLGTAAYMSPEQARGEPVDERTDVWSLGAVLYEMLGGKRAFSGDSAQALLYQVVHETPPSIEELRRDVPPELASIVRRALAKDPNGRFASIAEMRDALKTCSRPERRPGFRRKRVVAVAFVISIIGWAGSLFWGSHPRDADSRAALLVEAHQLIGNGQDVEAFYLLESNASDMKSDPALFGLFTECSGEVTANSIPEGATVYYKDYLDTDGEWVLLGTTPIEEQRVPLAYLRLRIVKNGYQELELAANSFVLSSIEFELIPDANVVEGMMFIPAGWSRLGLSDPVQLPPFWMDTYEVTNKAYQEFVDAGGYQEERYWNQPFVLNGRVISWPEAMELFKDATGRPGPANWELGHYPEGGADLPTGGVSWYEAAAYLEFAGKQLPTVYHWRHAAGYGIDGEILLLSNFESDAPASAGSFLGLSPFGNYDMAGNLKEWCWNSVRELRYSLGGAWTDAPFEFMTMDSNAQTPFTRSPTLGFRGMKIVEPFPAAAMENVERPVVDFASEKPVDDELFAVIRESYAYDRTELEPRHESTMDSEHWTKQKVSFRAAYGQERVPAYLFLPKNATPPYQTVIYFPGGSAEAIDNSDQLTNSRYWDFVIQSGRALLYPVYENMYERQLKIPDPGPNHRRDNIRHWSQDIQRSIDYLETRPDIDSEKIAYYGLSLGSTYAPIYLAIETRFRCSVLLSGGLFPHTWAPDVMPLNFVPRAQVPVLMVNGKYDFSLPVETSVKPMLALLGAPEQDKQLFLYEGDHIPRANEVVRVTLDWLDRYLGAPR